MINTGNYVPSPELMRSRNNPLSELLIGRAAVITPRELLVINKLSNMYEDGEIFITNEKSNEDLALEQESKDTLAPREVEVLRYMYQGLGNIDIAHNIGISTQTVKNYTVSIYHKLGASGRANAVMRGVSLGIIPFSAEANENEA